MSAELYEAIYTLVRQIPRGNVSTYGAISKVLAINPRVVGYALHRNPSAEKTPCHRVVFKDGQLSPGYVFGGEDVQRAQLKKEGICFSKKGKVIDKYFWENTFNDGILS